MLFFFCFVLPRACQDLRSPTRHSTHTPALKGMCNRQTAVGGTGGGGTSGVGRGGEAGRVPNSQSLQVSPQLSYLTVLCFGRFDSPKTPGPRHQTTEMPREVACVPSVSPSSYLMSSVKRLPYFPFHEVVFVTPLFVMFGAANISRVGKNKPNTSMGKAQEKKNGSQIILKQAS